MTLLSLAWFGGITLFLIAVVAALLLLSRMRAIARDHRKTQFEREWLPRLVQCVEQLPDDLPLVHGRDVSTFLELWNRVQESLLDDSKERLNELARRVGMEQRARLLLADGNMSQRLLAMATLGQLRDRSAWDLLMYYARGRDLVPSLTAARALMRIDPTSAVQQLCTQLAEREDWSPVAVAQILREADGDALSGPLSKAVANAAPEHAHRIIRLLDLVQCEAAVLVVREVLRNTSHVESIMACLRVFKDPADLDTVRRFLTHPRWEVRVRAAVAVGRIGTADDVPRLVDLLSDREWWVRYRAAQALRNLSVDPDQLDALCADHPDGCARDILAHTAAEGAMA